MSESIFTDALGEHWYYPCVPRPDTDVPRGAGRLILYHRLSDEPLLKWLPPGSEQHAGWCVGIDTDFPGISGFDFTLNRKF